MRLWRCRYWMVWLGGLAFLAGLRPVWSVAQQPTLMPAFDDYGDMLGQLGIRSLRPGVDPNNPATFDQAGANRLMHTLPDALTMRDGTKITRPEDWPRRRAEIAALFEREVYGQIPANVPGVTWEVKATREETVGDIAVITRDLVGRVETTRHPGISVEVAASLTVPANLDRPIPVMVSFAFAPRRPMTRPATNQTSRPATGPRWTEQAIRHGWGYATLIPTTVQPDNNQLTQAGIIALTNEGRPRTPEQWGALRAWQWGASRLLDAFEQHAEWNVDTKRVGIEGLSRYGKAALVTMAYDERFAIGLIGSSGMGGAKLSRHLVGESVENLAGGLYYWMAGNFIRYGASEPEKTVADLPVDSHELIALCAPRPIFLSHGVPEKGDALWIDARGAWMAGILASEVYELLGRGGLGVEKNRFMTEPMPPVGTLVGQTLAWRQHEGGHEVTPNWPSFFSWAKAVIP